MDNTRPLLGLDSISRQQHLKHTASRPYLGYEL
jgi:hypothetical protein